jgi:hypothetical protein
MANSSFYMLEISCSPGGARKGDFYVYNTLNEIKNALVNDFCDCTGIYMAAWYGERIFLYIVDDGQLIHKIDLLPRVLIAIEGIFDIQFEDREPEITRLFRLLKDENEDDKEILGNLTFGLLEIQRFVSDDLSEVKLISSLECSSDDIPKNLIRSQYMIYVDIDWSNITIIQGNI